MSESGGGAIADELAAIGAVAKVLEPLASDARVRVIDYVARAFAITVAGREAEDTRIAFEPQPVLQHGIEGDAARSLDIRSLKEEKQPKSANEMAALVGYYVAELAPPDERAPSISTADIERYFKQAGYPLPARAAMTLPNAANSGYFDSAGRGQWRLNPVGHNLVAHALPSGSSTGSASARTRRPKVAKKTAKKGAGKTTKKGAKRTAKKITKKTAKKTAKKTR